MKKIAETDQKKNIKKRGLRQGKERYNIGGYDSVDPWSCNHPVPIIYDGYDRI